MRRVLAATFFVISLVALGFGLTHVREVRPYFLAFWVGVAVMCVRSWRRGSSRG